VPFAGVLADLDGNPPAHYDERRAARAAAALPGGDACLACQGRRLQPACARAVRVQGKMPVDDFMAMPVDAAREFARDLRCGAAG